MAPFSSIAIFSIFDFFHASFQDFLFAISCVVEVHNVSTILRLCALSDEPVSVSSTIASTRPE